MISKQVNSNCPEFGYELLSAVPYAYNLYLKGELGETVSGFDTKCLYFFNPNHIENNCSRSWDNMDKLWKIKFPNINIHRPQLDWDLFSPPPFKEFYKDKSIKFDKETIVIFNRYNVEWGQPPINYLDLKTLDVLFDMLSDEYQVVYINLNKGDKYFDGAKPMNLNDGEVLKNHPKVYSLYDLMDKYPELSINEIQLRLFANCSKYISSNGGQLILSAYFGGENIIFSKKCRELSPEVNSFYKWYHKLGGGVFQHVDNYSNLIELVRQKWVLKKPLINILVRTSGRPNFFKNCMDSIYEQTYMNWNIIIGIDNKESLKYTQSAKGRDIFYNYSKFIVPTRPNNENYGIIFKYNLYLNDLQNQVNDGYIIYLDDDDKLGDKDSLWKLVNKINGDDDFIIWRVGFPNRLVPSDENFGTRPKIKDISGIGFSFNVKHKVLWEPYKRGDFRVANELYDKIPNKIFLDEVITKLQRETEDGFGRRDDLKGNNSKIVVLSTLWNASRFIPQFVSSIKSQTYKNFKVIVVDDNSSDKSFELLKKLTDRDVRFTIIKNNTQKFKTQNFYEIIHNHSLINDNDIIVELDGDDSFYNKNVLETVRKDFNNNIWIGGYKWIDNRGKQSPFRGKTNADNPRSLPWSYSAMRVFRAFLFRNISKQDLMFKGEFVKAANDVTYGMPMLEMAGNEHYHHSNEITYLYNWHSLNTHTNSSSIKNPNLQKEVERHIYSLPRYKKLDTKLEKGVITYEKPIRKERVDVPNNQRLNQIKKIVSINKNQKHEIVEVINYENPIKIEPSKIAADVTSVKESIKKLFIGQNPDNNNEKIKVVNKVETQRKIGDVKKIKAIISSDFIKHNPIKIQPKNSVKVLDENKLKEFKNQKNNQINIVPEIKTIVVKPQDKKEIDKRRKEFENIFLYGPKGKKEINPITPKSIGVSI